MRRSTKIRHYHVRIILILIFSMLTEEEEEEEEDGPSVHVEVSPEGYASNAAIFPTGKTLEGQSPMCTPSIID